MSPQIQHFIRPTSSRPPSLVSVTIVSAVVGLATGAAGFSLFNAWYPVDVSIDGTSTGRNTFTIKTEQSLVAAVAATADQIFPVYQVNTIDGSLLSGWRIDNDYVGSAVPVTSDGWLMLAPGEALPKTLAVDIRGTTYPVVDRYSDRLTGLRFIKVANTSLRPLQIAKTNEINTGSTLVYQELSVAGTPVFNRVLVTSDNQIDTASKVSQTHSTTAMDTWTTLDNPTLNSKILFTPSGSLAGAVFGAGKSVRVAFLQSAVDKLLTRGAYVDLGLTYVDRYRFSPQQQTKDPRGVIVYNSQRSAIVPGSVAQKAGLRNEDIIVSIDSQEIGYDSSLMEILASKRVGDLVTFKIIRQGNDKDVAIQL